nr:RNA-directed DNA polymerase, eukaryota, reverse transcriptase zinc-binding domain protein [Tanacetum cinerariifolium]
MLQNLEFSGNEDTWLWDLDQNGLFSVSSAQIHIDSVILHSGGQETRWCNLVPIKVNILGWRINMDWLPVRKNLVEKWINLPSLLCSMCGDHIGDVSHVFERCEATCHIWEKIFSWLEISTPMFVSFNDIRDWVDFVHISHNRRKILEAVILTAIWII